MALAKLKITNHGGHGRLTFTELNGVDISDFLTEVSVTWDLNSVVTAKLTINVGELEVDTATMAVLAAHCKSDPTALTTLLASLLDVTKDEGQLRGIESDKTLILERSNNEPS